MSESSFRFPSRVDGLRAALAKEGADAAVITNGENVRYLTGFTGSNGLVLVTPDAAVFLTDGRYTVQSAREVTGWERVILPQGSDMAQAAGEHVGRLGARQAAFEEAHLTVKAFEVFKKALPENGSIVPVGKSNLVENLRQIKDADEVAAIKKAVALADACFDHVQTIIKTGMTERELAWQMEVFLRSHGAQRLSFETIVASGPNAALPHARPSDRKLGESGGPEFLILDYGAELDGYCSDITRTLIVGGQPTPKQRTMYDAVLRTQLAALDAIKPGVEGKAVDQLARDLLTKDGLGELFTHGLGHALGRVVHDGMGFSQKSTITVQPGMVLTVEPGVYEENFGGVRIEDDIVVTETGCEVLTQSTKELLTVG